MENGVKSRSDSFELNDKTENVLYFTYTQYSEHISPRDSLINLRVYTIQQRRKYFKLKYKRMIRVDIINLMAVFDQSFHFEF